VEDVFSALTMRAGSKITGNSGNIYGQGVEVYGGSFTMEGGEISGNNTTGFGGGVTLGNVGSFTMKTGKISDNTAISGGGVYLSGGSSFTMEDGEISGNTAIYGTGGGVFVGAGRFKKTGGTIYGDDDNNPDNGNAEDNTVASGNTNGHAVYMSNYYDEYYRDATLGTGDDISTARVPATASGAYDATNWIKKQ
jgi:hypothetical protein